MLKSMGVIGIVGFLLLQLVDILQTGGAAPPALSSFVAAFPTAATSVSSPTSKTTWRKIHSRLQSEKIDKIDAQISASPSPIIDQEGRQWRSSAQLASQNLIRDGLADLEFKAHNTTSHNPNPNPFVATLRKHSLFLRETVQGESENEKKGRFVNDDERWMHRYDALCKFQERYGHTCVPFRWGILMGNREESGGGESKIRKVSEEVLSFFDDEDEEVGPSLRGNINEVIIDESSQNMNIQLSSEFTEPYLRLELGYWVAQQRHYYKQRLLDGDDGIGRRLTPDRIEYLDKLDFIWDVKEARWETQYMHLQEYIRDHGHACVTQNSTLGHWCYKQRYHKRNIENGVTVDCACIPELSMDWVTETASGGKEYKGRPVSPLTPERRTKLDAVGFIWDVREQAWEEQFQSLREYQQKHKTTKVPLSHGTLGAWVKKQREAWKHQLVEGGEYDLAGKCTSALTPGRIEKLDSINFSWHGRDYTWEEHYQHLLQYKKEYDHVHVGQKYDVPEKYPKLGSWLTVQRAEGRKFDQNNGRGSRLTKEKYDLLQRAGVQWDPLLSQFQSRVEQLRQYQKQHGTLKVKSKHKSLYSWVRRMTKEYENVIEKEKAGEEPSGLLLEDDVRRQMLDDLGFKEELVVVKKDNLE